MPSPQPRTRAAANPPAPVLTGPVEVLDERGEPLLIMPMLQAAKLGLGFRKAVTALYAGERLFLRRAHPLPLRRESRREVFDLFVAPVPAGLAPEDVAAQGLAMLLGYEPAVRFRAEVPPGPQGAARLSLFGARLSPGAEALPSGKGLLSLDADELSGLASQIPEQFSQELLRIMDAGLLFGGPGTAST